MSPAASSPRIFAIADGTRLEPCDIHGRLLWHARATITNYRLVSPRQCSMRRYRLIAFCCASRPERNWSRLARNRNDETRGAEELIAHMILQNALHRPVRTAITIIAVAVEVTLVIIVVGLTSGMLIDSATRTEGVGADIMVQPPSASVFIAFSGAPMPIAMGGKLEQLEYVQAVAPVLLQFNSTGLEIVYGIQQETFKAVTGGFVFHEGHDLAD